MDNKTIEFLQKLKDSGNWNDEYDYSKVEYINSKTIVLIIDRKFNTEHLIWASSLLKGTKCCTKNLKDGIYTYDKCKNFINSLNLKSHKDFKDYCKSNNKSHYIISYPDIFYKNDGWISWSDFLGSNNIATRNRTYLKFEDARNYVRSIGLKNKEEWINWCKNNRPNNIPALPERVYKNDGYISFHDWIGSIIGCNWNEKYLSFDDAIQFVHTLKLNSFSEWVEYCKSVNKPYYIPASPEYFYKDKGWKSFKHWLTGIDIDHLPFDKAKEFVSKLNFKGQKEYKKWHKTNDPDNLPFNPDRSYKDKGWISWGDFLNNNTIANKLRIFLSYEEVKKIIKPLNLKSLEEYQKWYRINKPNNIPANPYFYEDNIGFSMGNFLGYVGNGSHDWRKNILIDFIKSIQDELVKLDSIELITIINSNNLSRKIKEIGSLEDLISSKVGSEKRSNIVKDIISKLENKSEEDFQEEVEEINGVELKLVDGSSYNDTIDEDQLELKTLDPIQELRMYDNNMITASLDDENLDFLMKNQLKKVWNIVLNKNEFIDEYRNETGGERFTIIKNWFFDEYEKVIQIKTPDDYIFKHQPNLMQKLITYRLINEKRYGNWSGTGAGKTLSAIFAGRYAGAKNTLIICNNATVEGWVKSINEYFSNNKIYTKKVLDNTNPKLYSVIDDKYHVNLLDGENNYLILNYETFQLEDGEYIVSELLKSNTIDYIILDEVQNVKQRDGEESTRRNVVSKLIIHSKEKNEDLLVMAMSATPVINNLTEPKKLIELLTGKSHDELNTVDNILNGIEMYKTLTRHGLRYKPDYGISVNLEVIEIDGKHLSEEIIRVPKGAVAEFEKVLIQTKLDGIKDKIKKGTLIYTHYVTELSNTIGDYIRNLGFSVGYYTGEDKNGLQLFKDEKIDVLIGSSPIGTGVDGIQEVCNTLIPIILPWTSSEYDQLVGRINRQGSKFKNVNIYIPQVTIDIENGGVWSWDKRKHNIIKFKSSLADLAVDGIIPKNLVPSHTKLMEEAKKELSDWINRLQDGNIITFEREEFMIPLNPIQIERSRNKLGDFSDMNKSWSVTRSDNTHERLSKNNEEWYYYHTLYSEKRKTWLEIPFVEIGNKIKARPEWVVGDFGCGENLLSKEIKNKVHAFDHVAIDDEVIACDIKNVPLADNVLDVAVFSLSLMGSNYDDYLREAYRTLKPYGCIFICEPAKKWDGREDELKSKIESIGFKCPGAVKNTDKFIYIDGIKY